MKTEHQQQLEHFIKDKDYSAAESFLISIKSEYPDDLDYLKNRKKRLEESRERFKKDQEELNKLEKEYG